jgi:glutamyl-tRNA synthetase
MMPKATGKVVGGPVESRIEDEDREFIAKAKDLLPDGEMTLETWGLMDISAEGGYRPQGAGAVHAASPRAHGSRSRS